MSGRCTLCVRLPVLAIWILAVGSAAHAADRFWGNHFGGTFHDPTNWQGGSRANPDDIAHFGLTNNPLLLQRIYTVEFTADVNNQALVIEDDFVTFDLNSRTYATTLATGNEIGNVAGRSGRLTITDGTMLGTEVRVGAIANAFGSLTLSTGGLFIGSSSLNIGLGNWHAPGQQRRLHRHRGHLHR